MSRCISALLTLVSLTTMPAFAQMATRAVEYRHGTTTLEGLLVYDSASPLRRPAVLLAHELGASSPIARAKAEQIARLGYAAFCVDLYGKGASPKDATDAAVRLGLTGKDRTLLRERMAEGMATAEKLHPVDPKRLAAVGYGVGGTAVLELARAKGELEGVVCVHGDLTPSGDDGKNVIASVLAIVGADDPRSSPAAAAAFEEEMRKGGVDWQVLRLGGVVGDFTNPLAGKDFKSGRAYDPDADKRTSDAVRTFLAEMFLPAVQAAGVAPKALAAPKALPLGVQEKVLLVLEFVDRNGHAMEGYEGGRTFGNFERRLPQSDDKGRRLKYREWDVNPLRPGVNRGAERLVTSSNGAAYYTSDHYDTFKRIRTPGGKP